MSLSLSLTQKPQRLWGKCEQRVFPCARCGADSGKINDFPAPGSTEAVIKGVRHAHPGSPVVPERLREQRF